MKFGKIRIEDGNFIFAKRMLINYLPCKDILWAYMRREGVEGGMHKQFSTSSLVIITRRRKRYEFEMTDKEIRDCIQLLKARDGRHILPHRLLRSGCLYHISLQDEDTLLDEYHLSTVVDFRTRMEILQKPDSILEGVEYHEIPIVDEETLGITRSKGLLEMLLGFDQPIDEFMQKQYISFVRDDFSVKEYARFLDVLLHQEDGAVLWHCSMGKDRVGVGTALLLCALGIPRETIMEDYLRTNRYLEEDLQHMIRLLETKMIVDNETMDKIKALYRVKEEYLEAVFETIEQDYGSEEVFMRKALYLTPKAIEALRRKYLV